MRNVHLENYTFLRFVKENLRDCSSLLLLWTSRREGRYSTDDISRTVQFLCLFDRLDVDQFGVEVLGSGIFERFDEL